MKKDEVMRFFKKTPRAGILQDLKLSRAGLTSIKCIQVSSAWDLHKVFSSVVYDLTFLPFSLVNVLQSILCGCKCVQSQRMIII